MEQEFAQELGRGNRSDAGGIGLGRDLDNVETDEVELGEGWHELEKVVEARTAGLGAADSKR
ncbi:MAG TPA: hypothetical protein VFA05_07000 [Gaiellaceae bacterium]|nr:hypothetical protein [Gaiellaceae bacterium]